MTLDHCPFCAAKQPDTVVIQELGRFYRVYCMSCGAAGPFGDTEMHAANLWNQRSYQTNSE